MGIICLRAPLFITNFMVKNNQLKYQTAKHLYLAVIFIGAFGGKYQHRQNMRARNTVSNSVTWKHIHSMFVSDMIVSER